jgi:N-acetylmuramoyl-L-alanine amidase|tara:strand:- start:58414 stop:59529 length:1116 start_codon:yes stop_codon:yes gene_type:complete
MQRLTWFLIVTLVLPYFGFTNSPATSDHVRKVIIDAGHGGKDPGNLGTRRYKTYEKDIALSVALETAKEIEKEFPDVEVILTRDSDRFLELYERTALANREKGDLFISIHCDAVDNNSAAYGTTTYVMGKNHDDENQVALRENSVILLEDNYKEKYEGYDPRKPESYIALTLYQYAFQNQSIELAQIIQNSFKNDVGRRDRGVKQQPLYVTSRCSMPSVLVELGFLTNSKEEDFLLSLLGQKKMAKSIATSFGLYKSRRELNSLEGNTTLDTKRIKENKSKKQNSKAIFCVQLSVSGLKKPVNEKPFSALRNVSVKKEGRLYRYLQGEYNAKPKCDSALTFAKKNGFTDAFIVAYKNDKKISLEEAKRLNQ